MTPTTPKKAPVLRLVSSRKHAAPGHNFMYVMVMLISTLAGYIIRCLQQ